MKLKLLMLGLLLQGTLSPLAWGETSTIAPRKYALGVRAESDSQLVFVRCAGDVCDDISNPWQVAIFQQELQAGLAAAKTNALLKAGLFAGLGMGTAWSTYKLFRTFDEFGLLSSDARAAIAEEPAFYKAMRGPVSVALDKTLMVSTVAADVARIFALPVLAGGTLLTLGTSGEEIWQALSQPTPAQLQAFLRDRMHQRRVYVFTEATDDPAVIKSQEAELNLLFDRIVADFGA